MRLIQVLIQTDVAEAKVWQQLFVGGGRSCDQLIQPAGVGYVDLPVPAQIMGPVSNIRHGQYRLAQFPLYTNAVLVACRGLVIVERNSLKGSNIDRPGRRNASLN